MKVGGMLSRTMLLSRYLAEFGPEWTEAIAGDCDGLEDLAADMAAEQDHLCTGCGQSIFEAPLFMQGWLDFVTIGDGVDEDEAPITRYLVLRPEDTRIRCQSCLLTKTPAAPVPFPDDRSECEKLREEHPPAYDPEEFQEEDADSDASQWRDKLDSPVTIEWHPDEVDGGD